ncbi:MAG: flavoprotein [Candidatus Moranbacteria bacterium]|nr:flavoprotein [Candidatus Moranbacteria bacterium]
MLQNKIVYVIVTGATKAKGVMILLDMLKKDGAKPILMPTPAAIPMIDCWDSISREVIVCRESSCDKIPEEDIVIVAPCTFNTFSKISYGIADNYPMSILHAAIGKGKHVVVAPAMGSQYWNHPATPRAQDIVSSFGVEIVWPEYVYSASGELEKITMAPWEKIFDTVYHRYQKIRYEEKRIKLNIDEIVDTNYPEFSAIGNKMQEDHYTNTSAGFLAKRIDGGVLVTRSGSLVGNLSCSDLTLITDWKHRIVSWSGEGMPSSETPLILEIFNAFPDANVIIHGHCRDITYSSKMIRYHSSEYLHYGQWGDLFKIAPVLKQYKRGIMKLHGEIILANDFNEALRDYLKMYEETL